MKLPSAFLLLLPFLSVVHAQTVANEPVMTINGESFDTWEEYVNSATFHELGLRCGVRTRPRGADSEEGPPSASFRGTTGDCAFFSTTIKAEYEPENGKIFFIPVVFHVIESTTGLGNIPDSLVISQVNVFNRDYLALPGFAGQYGNDARIFFYLATEDPAGNPTTGIEHVVNDTWFNDNGSYWNTLNWDTNRYLNIYTNNASGSLGYSYVPAQGGVVGAAWDGVVLLYSVVGWGSPIGPPYNKGRTGTHEVGHYLGLEHTFEGGCAGGSCYTGGDLICDTESEATPTFGCPLSQVSCSTPDPVRNYMNYTNDACMREFTLEQINRMRCTIENWRPNLDTTICGSSGSATVRNSGTNPNVYTATPPRIGDTQFYAVVTSPYDAALILGYTGSNNVVLGGGQTVLIDLASSWIFQFGPMAGPNVELAIEIPLDPFFCDLSLSTQAMLLGGTSPFALTNAVDMTIGSF